jgi:hypothetical protein
MTSLEMKTAELVVAEQRKLLDTKRAQSASPSNRRRHREARNAVCSRRRTWRPNFRECLARLSPGQKAGFEREIGFGGFEHLAAPSSPSRQRRGLSRRSHLLAKQMPKKRTRADS